MSSIDRFSITDLVKKNPQLSEFKAIIESVFYENHVQPVNSLKEAYQLAAESPGTIVTDIPVYQPEKLDIPADAKVLVDNCGEIVGRTAAARRLMNQDTIDKKMYAALLREAVYVSRDRTFYRSQAVVGLDEEFMVKANIMVPEGYESLLYSYLLNFQIVNHSWRDRYRQSKAYPETDLFLFVDPEWRHPEFPQGLALFDPDHNVAAVLGLRYFGEIKKATLTMAWTIAHRNGFVSCHGGMKQFQLPDDRTYTMAAFGLSGSGKSTITLSNHGNKYPIKVLHDDAFVVSHDDGSSIALEPAYFDKTQDYPMTSEAVKYFLTVQNVGVTLDDGGRKVLVTEDIRNGNGRTVKSFFSTPNRVNKLSEKINAVFWIMKDDSLPPLVKINDPVTAAVFGATLATKRTTAENVSPDVDLKSLVIEPFANPFRVYPLAEDYEAFKQLFFTHKTDCYILNTDHFNGKKVTPQITLGSIEAVVEERASFEKMGDMEDLSYLVVPEYQPDFNDAAYVEKIKQRLAVRRQHILANQQEASGFNDLPSEAVEVLDKLIQSL